MRRELPADQNIGAALNHEAGATAVLVEIAQAVGLHPVDDYGLTAGGSHPGIGAATVGVDTCVANAQRQPVVYDHVGRTGLRRTHANVWTLRTSVMRVRGHKGIISESGLRLHCMLRNIPQPAAGRCIFWR
jgi:hypothetical protein